MASTLDEIVITDGNRQAFETILSIGREHEGFVELFVWGPPGTGKSTVVHARGRERDLLAPRRIVSCHAGEIVAVLQSGANDEFLNRIGEADVLLLDGVDRFVDAGELGAEICRLLLAQRKRAGLDTVAVSDVPLEEIASEKIREALADFSAVEVKPLDAQGLRQFAERIQNSFVGKSADIAHLNDDVLDFIAQDFAQDAADVRNALRFLFTEISEEERGAITREKVAELLVV